jgi:hypothetical protein
MFIVGTTGRGKSSLLQAEADRLGISYDDLLRRMEPSPEQKEMEQTQWREAQQKQAIRLAAVCEAYWVSSTSTNESTNMHDALVIADITSSPTLEQQKALFMMLPSEIIGEGIAWGFSDTVVQDSICQFVSDNREAVVERVQQAIEGNKS